MPTNQMNTGSDFTIQYFEGTSGLLLNLGDVQDIKFTALKHDIKSMPYNNLPRYDYVDDGFKIDFSIVRTSSTIEDFMVLRSQQLLSGTTRLPGVLNESVNNPDGTVSRYQYTNFVFFLESHGDVSRDKVTTLTGTGWASAKVKIA
jgi:hypothetical protein